MSFSQDADGTVTATFGAIVDGHATGGCCEANSCIGYFFESQVASMGAGDKIYFDYKASPPPGPPRPQTWPKISPQEVSKRIETISGDDSDP